MQYIVLYKLDTLHRFLYCNMEQLLPYLLHLKVQYKNDSLYLDLQLTQQQIYSLR